MKEWFDGIITWFQTTFSFLADKELLMMIGIVIMAIILIILIFKSLHRFRLLKVIFAVVVFGGLTFFAVRFVNTHKYLFSNTTNFYVYGKAGFVSTTVRTFELESNKSNLGKNGTGRIVVKVPVGTEVVASSSVKNKKLSFNDISTGDIVQVYCKESTLANGENEVTAVKIIKKYNSN